MSNDLSLSRLPICSDGEELNATLWGATDIDGIVLVLESRSGARGSARERNVDYLPALERLLEGIATLGFVVEDISVDSRTTQHLAPADRRLPLQFPLKLRTVDNLHVIRKNITEAQRQTARNPSAKPGPGGNNNKRLRLSLTSPQSVGLADLSAFLCSSG